MSHKFRQKFEEALGSIDCSAFPIAQRQALMAAITLKATVELSKRKQIAQAKCKTFFERLQSLNDKTQKLVQQIHIETEEATKSISEILNLLESQS